VLNNGNKVVVGGGEVCDACRVVAALRGGTEEIAKFWYGMLETCPEIAGMGIYLKTSGPGFFDADFSQRMRGGVERGSRLLDRGAVWKGRNQGEESVCRSSPTTKCYTEAEAQKEGSVTVIL